MHLNARKLKKLNQKKKVDDEHCMRELRIFLRMVIKELWKERKFQPFFHAVDEEVVGLSNHKESNGPGSDC